MFLVMLMLMSRVFSIVMIMLCLCASENQPLGNIAMNVYQAPFANMKMGRQRVPEMPLILGRSETQYVAMVTKLLGSNFGAHLESYCK